MTTAIVSEAQVQQLAESKIAETCAKHGVQRGDLKDEVVADAYKFARQKLEDEAQLQQNPYYKLYVEERQKHEMTQRQLEIVRSNRGSASESHKPAITVDQARAQMREQWYLATDNQRLQALGLDPASINRTELKELFGRAHDTARAVDYAKSNPARYAQLREAAKALNVYGN